MSNTATTKDQGPVKPLLTLQTPRSGRDGDGDGDGDDEKGSRNNAAVASVCFLPNIQNQNSSSLPAVPSSVKENEIDNDNQEDEEDSGSDFEFSSSQCHSLINSQVCSSPQSLQQVQDIASRFSLSGIKLASCHVGGQAFVWDLSRQEIISNFGSVKRKLGLSLQRMGDGRILYQTRDTLGTLSLHDPSQGDGNDLPIVTTWHTQSRTFCVARPCVTRDLEQQEKQQPYLVAMPSQQDTIVTIRDIRVSPTDQPAFYFPAAGGSEQRQNHTKNCGMMTSLGMISTGSSSAMVACGMENGDIYFHDLTMVDQSKTATYSPPSSISLGTDPILSLELGFSSRKTQKIDSLDEAIIAIAAMAGDASEIMEQAKEEDKGRVAVLKATRSNNNNNNNKGSNQPWTVKQRARVGIGKDCTAIKGKSGVAIARLRPDGRVFAVGGWDQRVRIHDRSGTARPLALLKGHTGSVDAVDWAPDSSLSGVIATGASDGIIHVWRCFNSNW